MIRFKQRKGRAALVVMSALVVLGITGCGRTEDTPEISSTSSMKTLNEAPLGEIVPQHLENEADLESDPAMIAVRETLLASAWANMTDSTEFLQFEFYIGEIGARSNPYIRSTWGAQSDRFLMIGPEPVQPISIMLNEKSETVVRVCTGRPDVYDTTTEERVANPLSHQYIDEYILTEMSDSEVEAVYSRTGVEFRSLRVRNFVQTNEECDEMTVEEQYFENWPDLVRK